MVAIPSEMSARNKADKNVAGKRLLIVSTEGGKNADLRAALFGLEQPLQLC